MTSVQFAKSRNDLLVTIFNEYCAVHGTQTAELRDVFIWALQYDKWEASKKSLWSQFRQEMSRALCEDRIVDPQGRSVRRYHAAKIEDGESSGYLWGAIFESPPDHMQRSLQQRRQRIAKMTIRHKQDTDSYNDNNVHGAQLYFEYDFRADIEESEMPTEYSESEID